MNELDLNTFHKRKRTMKIIILSILFTAQAQYIDDQSMTSTMNSFSLITQTMKESTAEEKDTTIFVESSSENNFNEMNNNSTILNDVSDVTKSPTLFSSSYTTDLDLITFPNEKLFRKEQWFNVNQSNRGNSYIFWRKINDGSTYIIRSEGQCLRHMCHVKLQYNGSLSKNSDGCLSFILWTRGQPVGQLWIEEDEQQESFSQKIQLTNSSLRVEHSLKSKIKNLSIDARILFRNSAIDAITLSNLNINWKGPCPKYSSIVTSLPQILAEESTLEDHLITSTSEYLYETSILTTNQRFESNEEVFVESSTIKFNEKTSSSQRSLLFVNQSNIGWILSLIVLFCLLIISSSFIYGLWTIQGHYRFIWYIPFDSPIQFLARRSIRSSTRSQNKIATLSQISADLLHMDAQQEHLDTSTTNSSRSTPFYTYF